uniref:Opsin 8, group member b n=1 Tax=Scleropages formosus TaxID=113540 RepID=A0A8C9RK73_SCLFO
NILYSTRIRVHMLSSTVLSFIGNILVLVTAIRRATKLKPPELLSVNLAVTDLGAAVTMYPLAIASAFNHGWLGGDATCLYYGLMGFFFGVASMMTLTVMSVVRFIISLSLQSPKEKISKGRIQLLIMGTWVCALLWAVFPLLGWGKYGPEPFGTSCTLAWSEMKENGFSFVITMFLINLLIPATIIVGCYSGLALKLHAAYKSINNSNQIPNILKMHRKLLIIAVLISMGFIGCWTPYAAVSLWSVFRSSESIPPEVSVLPCLFAKSSTVYNPLVYYLFSKTFKREVRQLKWTCGRSKASNEPDSNHTVENANHAPCDGQRQNIPTVNQSPRMQTEAEIKVYTMECL